MRAAWAVAACCVVPALLPSPAIASPQPILAAPYEYLGWGNPQPPTSVMAATGVRDITLAFILSHGACNPEWDGARPLARRLRPGGDRSDSRRRRRRGRVLRRLERARSSGARARPPAALAGAYEKVIDAYSLKAIDIDIEHGEFTSRGPPDGVEALASVQRPNPELEISITFGTAESGPERDGRSLIADAAAIGFQPTVWTVMPFDFGAPAHRHGPRVDQGRRRTRSAISSPAYGIAPRAGLRTRGGLLDGRRHR